MSNEIKGAAFMADNVFFTDDDLSDVFAELEKANAHLEQIEEDVEMTASQRRYEEIIKKHRGEGKGNQ